MQVAKKEPKKTILVVDNDRVYLSLVEEFLTTAGYQVIIADNPFEAHHILNNHPIDLVLLDVRLINDDDAKDRTGLSLARDMLTDVPKIIVTRIDTADMARAALKPNWNGQALAVDFFVKTEDLPTLLTAVRQALLKTTASPIRHNGIPHHLYQKLQLTLQSCECCHSNEELRDIFAHEWLHQWQHALPQHRQIDSRVRSLIYYLWPQKNSDNKNGLVLFLRVLHENIIHAGDQRHALLKELAEALQGVC